MSAPPPYKRLYSPPEDQMPYPPPPQQVPYPSAPEQLPYPQAPQQMPYPQAPQQMPYPQAPQQMPYPQAPQQMPYPQAPQPTVVNMQPTFVGQPNPAEQTVVTRTVGDCPACRIGFLESEYSCAGILLALFFFPLGIICCLGMEEKRCTHCHATWDHY